MKVLVELRIPMPLTVEELELGMLHTIVEVPTNLSFLTYPPSCVLFFLLLLVVCRRCTARQVEEEEPW